MRKDSRLSRVLHVLIHMGANNEPLSSSQIGAMLATNPAVVRRLMASLSKAGFITTIPGRGGGWVLAHSLENITMLDIHQVFGDGSLFTLGLTDEHTDCAIEKSINRELGAVLDEAQQLIVQRMKTLKLSQLAEWQ